jgi:DNA-binding MarR family transcriptional regulator
MAKVKREKVKAENANTRSKASRQAALAAADRLHSTAIHLLRRVRQKDVASGQGPARLSALSVLVFGGPQTGSPKTLGQLAAAEQVKPPTMSRIVAGLRRSRLVEIVRDPDDARRMHIRATAKGTLLLQQARQRRIESLAVRLDSLTSGELAQLEAALNILESLLCNWR